jgi:hypothetical protein
METAICSSLTTTQRSTRSFAMLKAFVPTCGIARPSASVGCVEMRVGSPARSAAEKLAT